MNNVNSKVGISPSNGYYVRQDMKNIIVPNQETIYNTVCALEKNLKKKMLYLKYLRENQKRIEKKIDEILNILKYGPLSQASIDAKMDFDNNRKIK